jgi:serine protease inhibitor
MVTDVSAIHTILISAIHFKATWNTQVDKKKTSMKWFNGF